MMMPRPSRSTGKFSGRRPTSSRVIRAFTRLMKVKTASLATLRRRIPRARQLLLVCGHGKAPKSSMPPSWLNTQGFFELRLHRYRHLRLRRRCLELHLWRDGRMVRGQLDGARRRVRSFDRPGRHRARSGFSQFQWVGEIERRYELWSHPGKIAITGFVTRGPLGTYAGRDRVGQITGGPADIAAVRQYRSRTGVSVNLEQEITADLGGSRARLCQRQCRA